MDKLLLRGISIGIVVSTIVYGYFYYNDKQEKDFTEAQINEYLEANGLRKITIDEYNRLQKQEQPEASDPKNKETKMESPKEIAESTEPPASEQKEQPEKNNYVLTIDPGMYSTQIAESLEIAGIITDSTVFNDYLVEHNLNTAIQVGTYEVSHEMSIEEIADMITK
ncbi:hypothetical protein [Ferdinandcohnia sp. Marseille-Q9671]